MKARHIFLLLTLLATTTTVNAHHGSSISYDMSKLWTTWATVTEFRYANPHPTMTFDRKVGNGEVEHWVSELLTNPSMMARQGWTRGKTLENLQPGTRIKLTLATSRAGGFSGIIMAIEAVNGDQIGGNRSPAQVPDLDGVPGGLQPQGDILLPGQTTP